MKYYAVSDIHSHCEATKAALTQAGFDAENPEHVVVLVGDAFDRGTESVGVYEYLKELLRKKKLVWILGNHEYELLGVLNHKAYGRRSAGAATVMDLARYFSGKAEMSQDEAINIVNAAGVREWITENTVPYLETAHYVFSHGGLPVKQGRLDPDWRNQTIREWYKSAICNGMKQAVVDGITIPGKTHVCGHKTASYGNVRKDAAPQQWYEAKYTTLEKRYDRPELFLPYYGAGVICLDACTTHTHRVNCVMIEDETTETEASASAITVIPAREYPYASLSLCILDAVYRANSTGAQVAKVISRYTEVYPGAAAGETLESFLAHIAAAGGPERFSAEVVKNRGVIGKQLRADICRELADRLCVEGIETIENFRGKQGDDLMRVVCSVKGVGPFAANRLFALAGR